MRFYHVLASFEPQSGEVRTVFSNLSEQELLDRFVQPYRAGLDIVVGNEIFPIGRIRKLFIVRTDDLEESVRAAINERSVREISEINRSSNSVVMISAGRGYDPEDILEDGEDVSSEFIGGPPGYAKQAPVATQPVAVSRSRPVTLLNHPWVVSVVGGLIVAAVIAVLALLV